MCLTTVNIAEPTVERFAESKVFFKVSKVSFSVTSGPLFETIDPHTTEQKELGQLSSPLSVFDSISKSQNAKLATKQNRILRRL